MTKKVYVQALEFFTKFPEFNYLGIDACGCMTLFRCKPVISPIVSGKYMVNYVWDSSRWGLFLARLRGSSDALQVYMCDRMENDGLNILYTWKDCKMITRQWFKTHKML